MFFTLVLDHYRNYGYFFVILLIILKTCKLIIIERSIESWRQTLFITCSEFRLRRLANYSIYTHSAYRELKRENKTTYISCENTH